VASLLILVAGIIGIAIGSSEERRHDSEVRDLEFERRVLMQRASVSEHRLLLVARF
jgi:hypothetical protein